MYRTRWSFLFVCTRSPELMHGLPTRRKEQVEQKSNGDRQRRREWEIERSSKGKAKREGKRVPRGRLKNTREKKRKKERETRKKKEAKDGVGPRVGCSPNSSTCPQDANNNIVAHLKVLKESRVPNFWPVPVEVMILQCEIVRNSVERHIAAKREGRIMGFMWHTPGPGSKVFHEENFYRTAHHVDRENSRVRQILSDKTIRKFDGIVVNARNCGTTGWTVNVNRDTILLVQSCCIYERLITRDHEY